MHAAAVTEQGNRPFSSPYGGLHKTIHERTRGIKIPRIVFTVEKTVRRYRRDRQPQFLLHLRRNRLRIVTNHAADTGVCNEYRLRMIFLCGKANALPQALLPAKDRLALPKPARQERNGRETYRRSLRRQPMEAAHIHPVRNVCAWTRAVEDDKGTAHKGERTPDARHTAAAVCTAHTDAFDLNPHSSPPDPQVPRTPSVSVWSASHSYRSPARVPYSAAPVPTPAHRR